MAEMVQQHMEDMLPEISSLKKTQLLSSPEISKLIEKRRAFEYKLAKLRKNKSDFISYAYYDIVLLDLLQARRERFNISTYRDEIEFSIMKRVEKRLSALTYSFPNDLNCWNMRINFTKSRMELRNMVSGIYDEQAKLLGKHESIWIEWAKWELMGRNNFSEARKILLNKAPLYHPKSLYICKEHFRLELLYVEYLQQSTNKDDLEEINVNNREKVLNCAIALAVYNKTREIFDTAAVNKEFYLVAERFHFAKEIQKTICREMVEFYPKEADTWKIKARRTLFKLNSMSNVGKVLSHFDEGLVQVGSSFINDYINEVLNLLFSVWNDTNAYDIIIKKLKSILASNKEQLDSSFHWLLWINLLDLEENTENERKLILNDAVKSVPNCSLIRHSILKNNLAEITSENLKMKTFLKEIKSIKGDDAISAWKLVMSLLKCKNTREQMLKKVTCDLDRDAAKAIWLQELDKIPSKRIIACRKFYKEYNFLPPFAAQFHICMLSKEFQQKEISVSNVRSVFEVSVRQFGKFHPGLWLSYIAFEHKYGDRMRSTALRTEGETTLNVDKLIEYKRLRLLIEPFLNQESTNIVSKKEIEGTPLMGWKPSIFLNDFILKKANKIVYLTDGSDHGKTRQDFFSKLAQLDYRLSRHEMKEVDDDKEWRKVLCIIFGNNISFESVESSMNHYFIEENARQYVSLLAADVVKEKQSKIEYSTELENTTEYGPIVDTEVEEILQKSDILKPDFGLKKTLPAYHVSKFMKKNVKKHKVPTTAGKGWFNMKAPEITTEIERDLSVFKMRSILLPDHHYKKGALNNPKFFQMGKVMDSHYDFYDRIPKKQRKRTFAEEIMSNEDVISYQKRKFKEISVREETKKKRLQMAKSSNKRRKTKK